jgi:hypothetical protein
VSFTYRTKGDFIHSIQITLSNGQTSPLFAGPGKDNLSDFKTLQIGDASLIKRVQGTKKGKSMRQIILKKQDGSEIGRIESEDNSIGHEHALNTDEEIIGVYGGYDGANTYSIGIIVWTPPKF